MYERQIKNFYPPFATSHIYSNVITRCSCIILFFVFIYSSSCNNPNAYILARTANFFANIKVSNLSPLFHTHAASPHCTFTACPIFSIFLSLTLPATSRMSEKATEVICSQRAMLCRASPVFLYPFRNAWVGRYSFLCIFEVRGTTVITGLYLFAMLLLITIHGRIPDWIDVVCCPKSAIIMLPLSILITTSKIIIFNNKGKLLPSPPILLQYTPLPPAPRGRQPLFLSPYLISHVPAGKG